jgi:hypothetical protein
VFDPGARGSGRSGGPEEHATATTTTTGKAASRIRKSLW